MELTPIGKLEFDYNGFPLNGKELYAAAGITPRKPDAPVLERFRLFARPEYEGYVVIGPRMLIYGTTPMGTSQMIVLDSELREGTSAFRIIVKGRPDKLARFRFPWKKRKGEVQK